jgi:cold shock CspA family protein
MTGTIWRIIRSESIGFIRSADGASYFFHKGAVQGTKFADLRAGQTVSFTLTRRTPDRGPKCATVTVVEGPA